MQERDLERAIENGEPTNLRDKVGAALRAMFALNAVAQSTPRALRARQGGTTAPLAQRTAKRRAKNKAARKARKRNR